jgi:hypothetical protein
MMRTRWPLAAFGMVAVIAAACGGAQSSSGVGEQFVVRHRFQASPPRFLLRLGLPFDRLRRRRPLGSALERTRNVTLRFTASRRS